MSPKPLLVRLSKNDWINPGRIVRIDNSPTRVGTSAIYFDNASHITFIKETVDEIVAKILNSLNDPDPGYAGLAQALTEKNVEIAQLKDQIIELERELGKRRDSVLLEAMETLGKKALSSTD